MSIHVFVFYSVKSVLTASYNSLPECQSIFRQLPLNERALTNKCTWGHAVDLKWIASELSIFDENKRNHSISRACTAVRILSFLNDAHALCRRTPVYVNRPTNCRRSCFIGTSKRVVNFYSAARRVPLLRSLKTSRKMRYGLLATVVKQHGWWRMLRGKSSGCCIGASDSFWDWSERFSGRTIVATNKPMSLSTARQAPPALWVVPWPTGQSKKRKISWGSIGGLYVIIMQVKSYPFRNALFVVVMTKVTLWRTYNCGGLTSH